MIPASPVPFRLKRSWQTFFALQWSQQRTFQIFYWVFFGEVMVGNGKLVITNFMNQPRPKLEIQVENWWFLLHLFRFVWKAPDKHSSYFNDINNVRFRYFIEYFLAKLWSEMVSWSSRISWTNHDRKLEIQVGNCCWLLRLFRFVWKAPDKHSSYFNDINNVRFRYFIEYFLAKLWSEMVSWSSRISWTNHNRKLEIQVGNCCWLLRLFRFVWKAPGKHSSYFNDINNVRFRYFIEYFFGKLWSEMLWCPLLSLLLGDSDTQNKYNITRSAKWQREKTTVQYIPERVESGEDHSLSEIGSCTFWSSNVRGLDYVSLTNAQYAISTVPWLYCCHLAPVHATRVI
jgi:hypothetical protein